MRPGIVRERGRMGEVHRDACHTRATVPLGRTSETDVGVAGAGVLCTEAAGAVDDLSSGGIGFARDARGGYALAREGGPWARRIVHADGAATGRRLLGTLSTLVAHDERIKVIEGRRAVA